MFAKRTLADDPLDFLSPAVSRFSDLIFDAFDVGQVVTTAEAARVAGLSHTTAKQYVDHLKSLKCWPYRSAKWRAEARAARRQTATA